MGYRPQVPLLGLPRCRDTLGWGTNLRVSVSPLPGLPSCRSKEGWGTGLRFVDRWQLVVFKMNLAIQMKQDSPSWRADKSCRRKLTPLTHSTQSTQSSHWIHSTHSTHSAPLTLPPLLSLSLSLGFEELPFRIGLPGPLPPVVG